MSVPACIRAFGLWALVALALPSGGQDAPMTADDRRRLADGLHARGLHDMALVEYREFLAAFPSDPQRTLVLYRAGESARRLNLEAEAMAYFTQAVEVGADANDVAVQRARLRLADLHLRAERFPLARAQAEALLAMNPGADLAAPALYNLGQAAYRLGDAAAGRKAFDDLVARYPENVFAVHAALALARQETRDPEARKAWYRQALRNAPSADTEVEALWGLATLEVELGRTAEAAEQFKRLWLRHPDSARVRGGLLHIAWSLMQAGRHAEALDVAADTSEARKREQADTWFYLEGTSLRMTGAEEKAIEAYRRLLREHPGSRLRSAAAYDLAVLHSQRKEHHEVLPLARDLSEVSDRREDALWLLAESARMSGNNPEAATYYTRLIREVPKGTRLADARYNLAVLGQADKPAEAAEAFLRFAGLHAADPRAATALLTAGGLWAGAGKGEEAAMAWERLLQNHPTDPRAPAVRLQCGLLRMRGGKATEAMAHFQAYVALVPSPEREGEAHYWLGILHEEAGDGAAAEIAYKAALARAGLAADLAAKARFRLGLILRRENRDADALAAWLPLLEDAGQARMLPDGLLVWILQTLQSQNGGAGVETVARAMADPARPSVVREVGFYALARSSRDPTVAMKAWQEGLALGSESADAAEASLALGRLLLSRKEADPAEARFSFAARLASTLDRGDLQARALQGMGDVQAERGNWAEAARLYMGVAVLWDDPVVTPRCLRSAADAFTRAGQADAAAAAAKELRERYPDFSEEAPPEPHVP